jgi:hypothetical protein
MASPVLGYAEVQPRNRRRATRCLRIRFQASAWHLSEDYTGRIGGIFTSLSAAIAFARSELRGEPGGCVLLDFDGAAFDGQP